MADSTALMRCPSAQHSARPQHGAKLVYLIRHAESRENVRVRAAGAVLSRLAALSLPRGQDLCAASRLLLCDLDAPLSDAGVEQVRRARERLGGADFLRREGIELVVHSSRQRTARTCRELFGQGPGPPVVESEDLVELKPLEYLVDWSYRRRLGRFLSWLAERPEERVAVVGHGQYFHRMLRREGPEPRNLEVRLCHFDAGARTFGSPHQTLYLPGAAAG